MVEILGFKGLRFRVMFPVLGFRVWVSRFQF